jgi:hypothetical protein
MSGNSGSSVLSELTDLIVVANAGNSSFVIQTENEPALFIDATTKIGVNTFTPGAQMEIAHETGECLRVRNKATVGATADISVSSAGDLVLNPGISTGKIVSTKSVNIINHNGSNAGLYLDNTLVLTTATELNYNSVTPGAAEAIKTVVLDADKNISGINSIAATTLTGALQTAAQPNVTSVGTLSSLNVTNGITATTLTGTLQTAAQPNITSVGTLSSLNVTNGIAATALTGTLQTAAQPNVTSVGNLSSLTVAGVSVGPEVAYLSGSVPGTAAASKAIVLDATGSIIGLNSISATAMSGTLQTAAQPNVTSVGTLSSLNVTNGITAATLTGRIQTGAQPNVTSVGNLSMVSIAGSVIGNEASYLSGSVAGTAAPSKVVVLGSTGNVDGITSLTATTLSGTLQTASQPNITNVGNLPTISIAGSTIGNEASYLSGSVAGTALASKAMVLDSSKSLSGITSMSATNITGTLLSAAQPNVTSVGTLTGVTISGSAAITSTSDATSSSSGAIVIAGGVGIAKRLYVGTGIYGTISTPAQPSITSLGSLTDLAVNGNVNVTGSILINGVPVTAGTGTITPPPDYVLSITPGTATNSKALVLNSAGSVSGISSLSATQLSGQLQTGAQPLITQIGTLSNLVVTNGIVASNLTGTLQTGVQPNITSLGILTALNVNGATTFMSAVDSTSLTTGSVKFNGGVSITRNLNVGADLNVIGSIKINGVAIGAGGGSGGSSTPTYVLSITPGMAVADKALVLDSSGSISGITSLTASTLTGTLSPGPQTGITQVGTLGSLSVSGTTTIESTTDAASSVDGGAMTISGGAAVAKSLYVGTNLRVAGSLYINNTLVNPSSGGGDPNGYLSVIAGTATASKALVLDSSKNISGITSITLSDSAQYTEAGISWISRTSAINSNFECVCWSPELAIFVAVAYSGNVYRCMTSPDGIEWTARNTIDGGWSGVCWSAELSIFVAVGSSSASRVTTSPDGINWTARSSPSLNSWVSVCWSPARSLFAAVAYSGTTSRIMTSPNGVTWTDRSNEQSNWTSICWSHERSLFVAVAASGTNNLITSPDGITWTPAVHPAGCNSICWSPQRSLFVAVGTGAVNSVVTSPDGINWTSRVGIITNSWQSVCWAPEILQFIAVGSSGSSQVMTSPDGITWTSRTSAKLIGWQSVCWSGQLQRLVAVANTQHSTAPFDRVMTSDPINSSSSIRCTDQNAFTVASLKVQGTLVGSPQGSATWTYAATLSGVTCVCWSEELSLFTALSSAGTGSSSTNGTNWTAMTLGTTGAWRSVCWSPQLRLFVAVASAGTSRVITSPNGSVWTIRTPASTNPWQSVCWSPALGLFAAVSNAGGGSAVMTSPDGVSWTSRAAPAGPTWISICWADKLSNFVAVSSSGASYQVMTSVDGINWIGGTGGAAGPWYSIAWSSSRSTLVATGLNTVMTSQDGITWVSRTPAENGSWNTVCWSYEVGLFVAGGGGTTNNIMSSPDGVTWTIRPYNSLAVNAVCWSSKLSMFAAGSSSWMIYSPHTLTIPTATMTASGGNVLTTANQMSITNTTAATSATTGALIVSGGIGCNTLNATNATFTGTATASALSVSGTLTCTSNAVINGNTTNSGNLTTGALTVTGAALHTISGTLALTKLASSATTVTFNATSGTERVYSFGANLTLTNSVTGTDNVHRSAYSIIGPTITSSTTSTIVGASTLYIPSAPVAGTGTTITYPYSLYIGSGKTYLADTSIASSVSTGALSTAGGVGASNLYISGASTYTSSTSPEALATFGVNGGVVTNTFTASNGTDGARYMVSIRPPTIQASSTSVTTTLAASLYISNAPTASTNMTISQAYALFISGGKVLMGDTTASTSTTTGALIVTGGIGCNNTVSARKVTVSGNISYIATQESESFTSFGTSGLLLTNTFSANNGIDSTHRKSVSVTSPLISATSTSVTTTNASTLFISGAPTASTNMTITNAYALYVNSGTVNIADITASTSTTTGALVVAGGVGIAGDIYVGGNGVFTGTVTQASDVRLKKNIAPLKEAEVKSLYETEVVTYNWKRGDEHEQVGVIAQDLVKQGLFNLVYSHDNESMVEGEDSVLNPAKKQWSVSYSGIAAYNMKMIQMLIAENKALKQRLDVLEQIDK